MKKYTNPNDYYKKDKELEKRRDYAVANGFTNMGDSEILQWAGELARFFHFHLPKFTDVRKAQRFIRIYYKR